MQIVVFPQESASSRRSGVRSVPEQSGASDCIEALGVAPLAVLVQGAFRRSTYRPLRQLAADVEASRIVLRGTVPTFYLKQLAQSVAQKLVGNRDIQNLVTVVPPHPTGAPADCVPISRELTEVCHESS